MIRHRDFFRVTGAIGKSVRDLGILPGSQWGVTMYNAGLPPERKIECIDEVSESRLSTAMFVQPLAWPVEALATLVSGAVITVSDSVQSGAGFFVTIHNKGLPDNEKIQGEDKRDLWRIVGPQAWPGIVIGSLAGGIEVFVYDSLRSGAGTFVYAYNFKMPDDKKIKLINDIQQDPRHELRKFGPQAIPGIFLGAVAGAFGITLADSAQSGVNAFTTLYNLGLPDDQRITAISDLESNSRPWFRKYCPQAWPGIAIGSLAAVPAMTVVDSAKTCASIFSSIVNVGLSDGAKITSVPNIVEDPRHVLRKGGIQAWPGIALGAVGGLGFVTLIDSICSGAGTFVTLHNLGLDDSDRITFISEIQNSTRNPYRKYLPQAWPGILFGAGLGALVVTISDTFRSGFSVFGSIYNVGLPDTQKLKMTEIQNDTRNIARIIGPQAWPGLLVGIVIGAPVAIFVDSFKSGAGIFTSAYNYGLAEDKKITRMNEIQDDARRWFRIFGPQAVPGIVIGSVAGVLVACFADGCRTTGHTFQGMYNCGLPEDLQIDWMGDFESDTSNWWRKSGPQTWPGYLIGAIAGGIAITVTDSARSCRSAFASTFNVGLSENAQMTCMYNLKTDTRDYFRKICPQAWPGILVGGLAGLAVDTVIDSFRSCFQIYASIYNYGMGNDSRVRLFDEIQHSSHHWIRKIGPQAWPGLLVGTAFGITISTIADSFKTGFGIFASAFNFGLADNHKISNDMEIQNDTRYLSRIIGPQAWPGIVGGVLASAVIITAYDSFCSGMGIFTSIYNIGLPEDKVINRNYEIQNDTRHWLKILGPQAWPGLLVGTIAALGTNFFVDNIKSGQGIYRTIVNYALPEADKMTPDIKDDQRHYLRKYLPHAWFGLATGAVLGSISYCAIKSGEFAVNSFEYWKALSGSILNVATQRPYFAGLSKSKEPETFSQSIAQGVGYGLAVLTTGILGSAIFLGRNVPDAFLLSTAVLLSPITSLVKGIAYLVDSTPRFPENLDTNQLIEDNFKDIYSALDAQGRLRVGENITHGDGKETAWSILRKCLTFNSKTPTELTLDALLAAFRANHDKGASFFTDPVFNQTIEGVKKEYKQDWLSSQFQIDLACQEVQDVADFVVDYMGEVKVTLVANNFYTRRETNWNTLFFGTKPQPQLQIREEVKADADIEMKGCTI